MILKINFLLKVKFFLFLVLIPILLEAQDYSNLYERLNPTVVTIQTRQITITDGAVGEGGGLGTGVIIDKEGLIMTAAHVVESADQVMVKTYDGQVIEAEVISSVSTADVALLKLKRIPTNISVANLGNSDQAKIGSQIFIIGAPYGLEHSFSTGHISRKQKKGMILSGVEMEFIQTDAAINTGNSGGPMFNQAGELIGIVSSILSKSGGFEGIGFAASINPVRKILLEGSPLWTGFEGLFLNKQLAAVFNVPSSGGVLVQRVVSNSVASKAGLRGGLFEATLLGTKVWLGGDIILSVEKMVCDSPHDLANIKSEMSNLSPDEHIHIEVLRGGKVIELSLVFE